MIIYTYTYAQDWGRNAKHRALKNSYCHKRKANTTEASVEIQFLRDINKKKNTIGARNKHFDDCSLFMIAKFLVEFYFPNIKVNSFIRIEDGVKNEMRQGYNFVVKMLLQQ